MRIGIVFLLPVLFASIAPAQAPADDPAALVRQLGHEDYAIREDATRKLVEMGEKAVPALEEALKSEDLEVRLRAGQALRAIRGEGRAEEPREEAPAPDASAGRVRGFYLSIMPDKVKATLVETVDGKEVRKEYEAKSLEELKEKYPELRPHIGENGFRFRVGPRDDMDMDKFWERWNSNLDEDMQRWQEEMRRDIERMQRWLELSRDRPRRGLPEAGGPAGSPLLGVRASPPSAVLDAQLELRGRGLVIEAVEKDSLADRLGVQRFDIILELNGNAIRSVEDVARALRDRKEGDDATAKVVRRAQVVALTYAGAAATK